MLRFFSSLLASGSGLSPRVRGSHLLPADPLGHPGSIPACAGEPTRLLSTCTEKGVYPRVCGGAGMERIESDGLVGLSPRVRGSPSDDRPS